MRRLIAWSAMAIVTSVLGAGTAAACDTQALVTFSNAALVSPFVVTAVPTVAVAPQVVVANIDACAAASVQIAAEPVRVRRLVVRQRGAFFRGSRVVVSSRH